MDKPLEVNSLSGVLKSRWKGVSSCKTVNTIMMLGCITNMHPYLIHTQTYCIVILWSLNVCGSAKGGQRGDKKTEHPPHYLPHRQSANTKHRSEEKKGDYNRHEEEKQQFWQSCVDNFPGADLAKEATSVELQRQLLGCSGCFSSDVLQSTFFM